MTRIIWQGAAAAIATHPTPRHWTRLPWNSRPIETTVDNFLICLCFCVTSSSQSQSSQQDDPVSQATVRMWWGRIRGTHSAAVAGGKGFPLIKRHTIADFLKTRREFWDRVWASQVVLVVKNLSANAEDIRDTGSILGPGRSPGGGHGNPRQYSCLVNPMDRGAWRATVHGVAKSQTWLKRLSMHAHTHDREQMPWWTIGKLSPLGKQRFRHSWECIILLEGNVCERQKRKKVEWVRKSLQTRV